MCATAPGLLVAYYLQHLPTRSMAYSLNFSFLFFFFFFFFSFLFFFFVFFAALIERSSYPGSPSRYYTRTATYIHTYKYGSNQSGTPPTHRRIMYSVYYITTHAAMHQCGMQCRGWCVSTCYATLSKRPCPRSIHVSNKYTVTVTTPTQAVAKYGYTCGALCTCTSNVYRDASSCTRTPGTGIVLEVLYTTIRL